MNKSINRHFIIVHILSFVVRDLSWPVLYHVSASLSSDISPFLNFFVIQLIHNSNLERLRSDVRYISSTAAVARVKLAISTRISLGVISRVSFNLYTISPKLAPLITRLSIRIVKLKAYMLRHSFY